MKPEIDWLEYQRLEQISEADIHARSGKLNFWTKLKKLGHFLREYLKDSSQLRVWYSCDRQGKIWWSAYDPNTRQFINQVSEEQIRIWIERRY